MPKFDWQRFLATDGNMPPESPYPKATFRFSCAIRCENGIPQAEPLRKKTHPTAFTLLKGEMNDLAKRGGYREFHVFLLAEKESPDPDAPLAGKRFYAMMRRRPKGESGWISSCYVMRNDLPTLGEAAWHEFEKYAKEFPGDEKEFGGFYGFEEGQNPESIEIYVTDTQTFRDLFSAWCRKRIVASN